MLNGTLMLTNKNNELKIDNKEITIKQLKDKLREECLEVIDEKQPDKLALEILDVIQVCVVMLWKIKSSYHVKLDRILSSHYKKLKDRGWSAAAHIHFMIERNLL